MESKLSDHRTYDDIIKECKDIGIEVTWRKLNYYKSLGLLPKPTRVGGDKRGYYPTEITNDLILYHFLQNDIGFTLKEIKELRDDFRILDKYIDLKKSILYSGNFTYIINATYAAYARTLVNDSETRQYFQAFGANSTILLNKAYKTYISHFQKTILPSILKEGVTKENFDKHIKERGRKAARTLIEKVKGKIARLKTAHD